MQNDFLNKGMGIFNSIIKPILDGIGKIGSQQPAPKQELISPMANASPTPSPTLSQGDMLRNQIAEEIRRKGDYNRSQYLPSESPSATPTPTQAPLISPTPSQSSPELSNVLMRYLGFNQPQPQPQPSVSPTVTLTPTSVPKVDIMARNPNVGKFNIPSKVSNAFEIASKAYDLPASILYDIALQESSFNPDLVNRTPAGKEAGNPTGLFQFTDSTWNTVKNYANKKGSSLKLPNFDRFDPVTNALAAAYLIKSGQLGRWDASKPVWGQYYNEDELAPYYSQTLSHKK